MNVGDCREFIRGQLDFEPIQQNYADHVLRLINMSLKELYDDVSWPWAQTEYVETVYADVTATNGTATSGSQNVTTGSSFFLSRMVGHILSIAGVEYTLIRVASATSAYIDRTYAATTGTKTFVSIERNIALPIDHAATQHIGMRRVSTTANADFVALSRGAVEALRLRDDQTGTPSLWHPADTTRVPAPAVAPAMSTTAATPWAEGTYTFVSTHYRGGYHSAPSPETILELDGTTYPTVTFPALTASTGYMRYLWMKYTLPTGVSYPKYRKILASVAETGGVTSLSAVAPDANWQFADALPQTNGQVGHFALYPRQSADLELQIRYQVKPPIMAEDSDELPVPDAAANWICYRAVEQLAVPKGDKTLSAMYRGQKEEAMTALRRRYLTEIQRKAAKGDGWAAYRGTSGIPVGRPGPVYHNP